MTYRPHSRVLPTSICAAVALSATTACSGIGPDDDLEFRTSDMPAAEAMPAPLDSIPLPNPNPDPDPDPEPEPMSADKMVGLTMEELVQQNAWFVTYQMDPLPSAPANLDPIIAQPDRGWPAHALQWKHEATQALTGATFDLAAAATAIGGVLGLGYGVAAPNTGPLNAMEAGGVVFHSSPNPSSDPPGDWLSERLTDPGAGLAFAALAMHFWDTPVYLDATHNYPVGTGYGRSFSHAIALQRLEFCFATPTDLLTACNLPTGNAAAALSQVPNCNHGAVLTDDLVTLWNDELPCSGCPGVYLPYDPNTVLTPAELITAWVGSLGVRGQLVFDPPAEVGQEQLEAMVVLAEAIADQLLIEGDDGTLVLLRDYAEEVATAKE